MSIRSSLRLVRPALGAAGASVAVLLGGCGSSDPAAAQAARVRATVQRALADLADGHGADFCALATPAARRTIASAATGYSCSALISALGSRLPPARRTALRHAMVRAVSVHGRRARVRIADIGSTQGSLQGFLGASAPPAVLSEQPDGSWKIAG